MMDRRAFILTGLAASVAVALPLSTEAKPIGRILDIKPEQRQCHGEYFFAHSQAQEDELYEAARTAAAQGEPLYFWDDEFRPPRYGQKGLLIFPAHGMKGSDTCPHFDFCAVVLLPETIWHPAFETIRRKAERW
jgi:hypothetical protein